MRSSSSDTLIDFFRQCSLLSGGGGIRIRYAQGNLTVTAGNGANGGGIAQTVVIPVAAGMHSLVVTERKAASGLTTQSLSIYVDGVATTMPFGTSNVYTMPSDTVLLPRAPGTSTDEYEFWPRDLSLDPEMLCENGWDGEWNPATGVCLLTANTPST